MLEILPVTLVPLVTKPTSVVPSVEELVPPLAMGRIPLTSEVNEACPLYKDPELDLTSPVPREERVVEPFEATDNRDVPDEEATVKRVTEGAVEVPWTYKVEVGAVVPIPTLPPKVLK